MSINTDPSFVLDLYEKNKKFRRTNAQAMELLRTALEALDRGKQEVAYEHIDRALDRLDAMKVEGTE